MKWLLSGLALVAVLGVAAFVYFQRTSEADGVTVVDYEAPPADQADDLTDDRMEARAPLDFDPTLVDPRRQDFRLEDRRGQRRALQLFDRIEQRVGAETPLHDPLPRRCESSQHGLVDRLDFLSQACQRAPPQRPRAAIGCGAAGRSPRSRA